ncbi:hypothetical protein ACFOG5_06035 [Pedobacter fastidiosus]|uniref:DUF5689 domain-containing protein n=1 Tax=Pedobacter fastidiosus TaxID=2765361 RepID=A0ABR7KRC6_9SPHI|nr:hypothetical protein [Pedobacter fastidiosus]MBC6110302.1 hypothetical protein [Pedobacter fastidiosus]
MKKTALIIMSLVTGLCLLIFSCRKDIENYVNNREGPSSAILESAKIWHLQNSSDGSSVRDANFIRLRPLWKSSYSLTSRNGNALLIVPTIEDYVDDKIISVRRVFVFTSQNQQIISGEIYEILGKNYDVNKNLDLLLPNINSRSIEGFNGAIIKYNINYERIGGSFYKDGHQDDNMGFQFVRLGKNQLENKKATNLLMVSRLMSLSGIPEVQSTNSVTIEWIGVPYPVLQNCIYTFWMEEVQNENGAVIRITYHYLSKTCTTTGIGSGSAGNGSGSGSGSGSGANGGGGPFGGNYTVVTKPCAVMQTAIHNPSFILRALSLKDWAKTQDHESLYINTPGAYGSQDGWLYYNGGHNGTDYRFGIETFNNSKVVFHNHEKDSLNISTFSDADFGSFIDIMKYSTGIDKGSLIYGMVNATGQSYMLAIEDENKFNTWSSNLAPGSMWRTLIMSSYASQITNTNSVEQNELNLVTFLKSSNGGTGTGIVLIKNNNSTMDDWRIVSKDAAGNITLTNCN